MEAIDPGHIYALRCLDSPGVDRVVILRFVKRKGYNYPGNEDAYPGTTTQEVLRALIDRTKYVDNQIEHHRNDRVLFHLRMAILELEERAAERHDRLLPEFDINEIEDIPVHESCGHIGCKGECD